MDVPSLSKSIGTTYSQNPSAVPTGSRREKIVELARNGRTPKELAEEFGSTQTTTRNWLKPADRDEGACSDGPTTEEKEEIRQLQLRMCVLASLDRLPQYRVRFRPEGDPLFTVEDRRE